MRSGMRERHKERGTPFDSEVFTVKYLLEWLLRQPVCECCSMKFEVQRKLSGNFSPSDRSPSIDRIDPKRGYVVGNVALICWRCNNLKRDATAEELERIVFWMRNRAGLEMAS